MGATVIATPLYIPKDDELSQLSDFDDRSLPSSPLPPAPPLLPNELPFDFSQLEPIDTPNGSSMADDDDKEVQSLEDRVSVLLAAPLSASVHARAARVPPPPPPSPEVVNRVVNALNALKTPVNAAKRNAIVPLVVRTLAEYRRSSTVAHAALLVLSSMTSVAAVRITIVDCGGVESTLDVMRLHSLQPDVQAQGCLLLSAVARHMPDVKPQVLDAGALLLVVSAMATHPRNETVQACGCLALRTLCRVDPTMVRDPHAAACAVEVAACALERFMPHNINGAKQALVAIANLASLSDVAKTRCGQVNAVGAVVSAVEQLCGNAQATDVALACLSVLVTDLDNQRKAVAHGAVAAIDHALRLHLEDRAVVGRSAACIRFLTFDPEHRYLVGTGGVLRSLMAALGAVSGRTLREVMHALGNSVAGVPTNKASCRPAVGTTARIIAAHVGANVTIVEDACRLLYALTVDCEDNQLGAAECGLLSALLEALRVHACASARVAEHATAVFVVLAYNRVVLPDVQRGASDLASILRRARAAHVDHAGVARQSRALVGALGIAEEDMALAWPSGLGDPWREIRLRGERERERGGEVLRCRKGVAGSSCL